METRHQTKVNLFFLVWFAFAAQEATEGHAAAAAMATSQGWQSVLEPKNVPFEYNEQEALLFGYKINCIVTTIEINVIVLSVNFKC